jgi:hypothetical protein
MNDASRVEKFYRAQKLVHYLLRLDLLQRDFASHLLLQVSAHLPEDNKDRFKIVEVVAGLKNIAYSYDVGVRRQLR